MAGLGWAGPGWAMGHGPGASDAPPCTTYRTPSSVLPPPAPARHKRARVYCQLLTTQQRITHPPHTLSRVTTTGRPPFPPSSIPPFPSVSNTPAQLPAPPQGVQPVHPSVPGTSPPPRHGSSTGTSIHHHHHGTCHPAAVLLQLVLVPRLPDRPRCPLPPARGRELMCFERNATDSAGLDREQGRGVLHRGMSVAVPSLLSPRRMSNR